MLGQRGGNPGGKTSMVKLAVRTPSIGHPWRKTVLKRELREVAGLPPEPDKNDPSVYAPEHEFVEDVDDILPPAWILRKRER